VDNPEASKLQNSCAAVETEWSAPFTPEWMMRQSELTRNSKSTAEMTVPTRECE